MLKKSFLFVVIFFVPFFLQAQEESDTVWTKNLNMSIEEIKYHPSGDYIVAAGVSNIYILNAENGELIRTIPFQPKKGLFDMELTIIGDTIITCDLDGYIILWDFKTGDTLKVLDEYIELNQWDNPSALVTSLDVSADGRYLYTCATIHDEDAMPLGRIIIYDLKNYEYRVLNDESYSLRIRVSPNNDYFVVSNHNDEIELWETETWKMVKVLGKHVGNIMDMDFSNDASMLVSGAWNSGSVKLWDMNTMDLIKSWDVDVNSNIALSVEFIKNDDYIIIGGGDKSAWYTKIWSVNKQSFIKEYPLNGSCIDALPGSKFSCYNAWKKSISNKYSGC